MTRPTFEKHDYTTYANAVHGTCGTPEECARLRSENAALLARAQAAEAQLAELLAQNLRVAAYISSADELTDTGQPYRDVDAALRTIRVRDAGKAEIVINANDLPY
jgi:hypothetical protein